MQIRGVSDSGWFLDREPFTAGAIAASEVVRQGWKLWNGVLPEACASEQKEPWRCYFGHHVYNTLKCKYATFFNRCCDFNFQHFSTLVRFSMDLR